MTPLSANKKAGFTESKIVWANPTILFLYELLIESTDKAVIPRSSEDEHSFLAWQYVNILRHLTKELEAISTFPVAKQHSFSFWKLNQSLQSRPFLMAVRFARIHNIELKPLWTLAVTQFEREQTTTPYVEIEQKLNFYSEAYGKFIGLIFRNGVVLTQVNANPLKMYKLGINFGKLVYILHTFEEYSVKGKSNIFHFIFKDDSSEHTIEEQQATLKVYFQQLHQKVVQQIETMGLEESKLQYFTQLLDQWVTLQLNNAFTTLLEK